MKLVKLSIALFLISVTVLSCTKQDFLNEEKLNIHSKDKVFLNHSTTLGPSVDLVLEDVKKKMNEKQIIQFIEKAGFINWDKAKAYASPKFSNKFNRQNSEDSIVILPVALPNATDINAALVAHLYNNGDSIIYSTHFKNKYSAIDSTQLPNYNITAREMYVLGMAQLDAEVFGHKYFILNDIDLEFGQHVNSIASSAAGYAAISIIQQMCEYSFIYSSPVVFPPVEVWSYSAPCGSSIEMPPAIFLEGLDETNGFGSSSQIPLSEGGGSGATPYSLEFSSFYQSLNANQQTFLQNGQFVEYHHGFVDYLILHQFSQEAKDKIIWCINYLLSPTTLITTFSEFYSNYLNDFPSLSFLPQDDINWINNYPYLKSRIYYYLQQPNLLNKEVKVQFHINKLRTEGNYFTFNSVYSTYLQFKDLWFNDNTYLFPFGGSIFGEWAINYLIQHPTVLIETFQNQFMGKSEGYEGAYDTYWDNPSLTFPAQNLPTWDSFNLAFPRKSDPRYDSSKKIFDSIGGDVASLYVNENTNTCAVRLSRALNYSGVVIPNIPGQTLKGADNKYYFKAAYQINIWMRKTFGTNPATSTTPLNTNHHSYTQIQAGEKGINLPALLLGKKGIYSIYSSDFNWATGHADLLKPDATCGNDCHFRDAPISRLDVWILN